MNNRTRIFLFIKKNYFLNEKYKLVKKLLKKKPAEDFKFL